MKYTAILTTVLLLGVATAFAQLVIAHSLSTAGIAVSIMERERDALELENENLKQKIASASSLLTISEKAKQLGFRNAPYTYIEKSPVALAKNPNQ